MGKSREVVAEVINRFFSIIGPIAQRKETALKGATDFLILATAHGYGSEVLTIIQSSTAALAFEPLIVGIKISLSEETTVAKEIREVGEDVAIKISKLRQELGKDVYVGHAG